MDNDEDSEYDSEPEEKVGGISHPAIEKVYIGSKTYVIKGTPSFKFLTQLVDTSKFPPHPGYGDNRYVNATARIKLMETEEGPMIIEMIDEIYFPLGKYQVVTDKEYTFVVYANMVEVFKNLGYQDIFPGNGIYSDLISGLKKSKDEYLKDWWERVKFKHTPFVREGFR